MLLKELRDKFLLTNAPGRWFVTEYYRLSPPVANFISHHEGLKIVVRTALYPLLAFSFILLRLSLRMQLFLAAVIPSGVLFGLLILRKRRGEQSMGKECGVRAIIHRSRRSRGFAGQGTPAQTALPDVAEAIGPIPRVFPRDEATGGSRSEFP
jgi:hypothetical protein